MRTKDEILKAPVSDQDLKLLEVFIDIREVLRKILYQVTLERYDPEKRGY